MDQSIIDASMHILIHSGDARRETYRAVEAMEQSDFTEATALLDAADGCIRQAHQATPRLFNRRPTVSSSPMPLCSPMRKTPS